MHLHKLWTNEDDLYAVVPQFLAVLPPIRIGGVQYLRGGSTGQCNSNKLAVLAVKRTKAGIRRKLLEPPRWVTFHGNRSAVLYVYLVIMEPLEKRITGSRLTGKPKVPSVLLENQALVIQQDATLIAYLTETAYALTDAIRGCLGTVAVGYDGKRWYPSRSPPYSSSRGITLTRQSGVCHGSNFAELVPEEVPWPVRDVAELVDFKPAKS